MEYVFRGQDQVFKRTHFRLPQDSSTVERLGIQVLKGKHERSRIHNLRRHAAFGVEADLDLGLTPFEELRDEIGIVTAISRGQRIIATIRFVPSGRNMTAAERLQSGLITNKTILESNSWEVGRIIMNPEDRDPELLPRCLALALGQLLKRGQVEYLHATTTMAMARLWRRFAMKIDATVQGASGERYALICGHARDVAAALNVPVPIQKAPAAPRSLAWNPWPMNQLKPIATSF